MDKMRGHKNARQCLLNCYIYFCATSVYNSSTKGIGFVPTPVGGKDNKQVFRVGDCVAIGNLRTVIWRAWDVCMKI